MHQGFFPPFRAKGRPLIHADAVECLNVHKRMKKVDQKKVKIRPALKLLVKDFIVRSRYNWQMLWRRWELYWAKTHNFTWEFFFLQWTAPDSFEPCQDMRHTPSPSQLLPPRDAPLLIVKKLGNMIYSAAAITVDMLSVAPRTREKIIGSDGGLIPVRKKMLLQTESWFMNACWCGIYFLSGEGKRSIRANVLSERLCISLAVVQNRAFSGIVIICDKVR